MIDSGIELLHCRKNMFRKDPPKTAENNIAALPFKQGGT